eukprot:11453412-Ditylum_brightwellii.AAC.1
MTRVKEEIEEIAVSGVIKMGFASIWFYCEQCDAYIYNDKPWPEENPNCWSEHTSAGGIKN